MSSPVRNASESSNVRFERSWKGWVADTVMPVICFWKPYESIKSIQKIDGTDSDLASESEAGQLRENVSTTKKNPTSSLLASKIVEGAGAIGTGLIGIAKEFSDSPLLGEKPAEGSTDGSEPEVEKVLPVEKRIGIGESGRGIASAVKERVEDPLTGITQGSGYESLEDEPRKETGAIPEALKIDPLLEPEKPKKTKNPLWGSEDRSVPSHSDSDSQSQKGQSMPVARYFSSSGSRSAANVIKWAGVFPKGWSWGEGLLSSEERSRNEGIEPQSFFTPPDKKK